MAYYVCQDCGYVFSEESVGDFTGLDEDWACPICAAPKAYFTRQGAASGAMSPTDEMEKVDDPVEEWMADIVAIADTGASIEEAMRTRAATVSWNDLLILGAQLARMPLLANEPVVTRTVIGPKAVRPLVLETPIYVSHMSYGALSREAKTALSKGSSLAKTAMCSGEGGILPESFDAAHRYIFEYVPNRYSCSPEKLARVDAVEIKVGQSAKPGMGGHLPGSKVTPEIAAVRGFPVGEDIVSPARFPGIDTPRDLRRTVDKLRIMANGAPIGVKIAAGHIERDIDFIIEAGSVDFITMDGRPGGTGSAPKFVKSVTSVPTLYAIPRARRHLDLRGARDITLVATGGLRISPDFAKAIALGADAVAVATSALIAIGCRQYKICHTGRCPYGITSQDPSLRARLDIEPAAQRLANFLLVSTDELAQFARLAGRHSVHDLCCDDLATTSSEIHTHVGITHV